ncbi:DUF6922 domain-containing protein [Pedobacter psychroterrae]|uniref:DUF6922 domain-containing protein n=1 Tax=Pedobacter psychroterrae TaxID=2530453 RepID=A0A4R0NP76_9SPHI|nr:hypothetical protein [Pedobacter psychroterrae]TCD01493.1 hypothetical protein EZ437_12205 [Pedobacter psychroterrae]
MYFDNYIQFPDAKLDDKLLWEFDPKKIDLAGMRNIVVQRVIERGRPDDWYFILNYYGIEDVKGAIKKIAYLNDKDMHFVSHQFDIPLNEMKCYEKKQSMTLHWNS